MFDKTQTSQKAQYVNMWVGMATLAANNDEMTRVKDEMLKLQLPFDEAFARQMQGTDEIVR